MKRFCFCFSDNISCHVNLHLEENSTAHARDVVVHVMIPHYMGYLDMFDVKGADVNQTTLSPNEGIEFSVHTNYVRLKFVQQLWIIITTCIIILPILVLVVL
jgi:hypothetical protein